jgi:hypothetical protein
MVETWVMIIFFHVGIMGSGNSNAVTSIPNFKTQVQCQQAGDAAKKLVSGTVKEVSYVCVDNNMLGKIKEGLCNTIKKT